MLPLVQRELRVAARRKTLHRNRLWFGMAVVLTGAAMLVFANPGHPANSGGGFAFFSVIALFLCLVEGPRKTSDAISEEKRAGTLGFLFLTDLRGWDIVLGKLVGAMVRSFSALLAFVPILSITLLVGGTTLGDFWRTVLTLLVVLFFSLSLCLVVSIFSKERSLSACVVILLCLVVIPWLAGTLLNGPLGKPEWWWVAIMSPLPLLIQGWESYYTVDPRFYWSGVTGYAGASLMLLVFASLVLPRVWQEKPRRVRVERSQRRERAEAKRRRRQLDENPILWVAYHPGQARTFQILFYGVLAACIIARFIFSEIGWEPHIADAIGLVVLTLLLNVYVASQSSMNLAEARRSGALELLLSTPLRVTGIIRGQILALKEMFLMPAVLLASLYLLGAIQLLFMREGIGTAMFLLVYLSQYLLGVCAIAGVGMWMGMTSKSPNRALFKTLFMGMILPYITCIPAFLVQIVLIALAKDRLAKNFRRYVAERYLQAPGFRLAPVPPSDPNVPPVIR